MEAEKNTPLVSFVVPVYNASRYIQDCLKSIQSQSVEDFEIICVNDGSTDDSATVIEREAEKDSRITLIHQENKGASGARNTGYDKAEGTYLTFVDADDEIAPQFIESLLALIERDNSDLALANTHVLTSRGKKPKYPNQSQDVLVRGADHEKYRLLSRNAPHGKLFRRSFLGERGLRYLEGMTYEDYHHWLECVAQNPAISLSSEFLYLYKRNPYSISSASNLLEAYNISSRIKQTQASLEAAADSNVPGLYTKTRRMQIRARLMRHIKAMGETSDVKRARAAFALMQVELEPLADNIREVTRGYMRLIYEILLQGSVEDLRKLWRWGEGHESLSLFIDTAPEAPKVYVDPVELRSIDGQAKEFFDVSDKVRKR